MENSISMLRHEEVIRREVATGKKFDFLLDSDIMFAPK